MAQWDMSFDKWAKKTKVDILSVIQESAIFMFGRIVAMSPVDTGRFRANWNCSLNSANYKTSETVDPSGAVAYNGIMSTVNSMSLGDAVFLCNGLPYAVALEYGLYPNPPKSPKAVKTRAGYSTQAPQGMVRVVVNDFQRTVDRMVRKRK